jgi:UDP-N-acetylglucosamine--N-acetylmuramyl-(pentapeptide) pyrophosphoryl-undecaprenol N-acetylglucosamine transferase
MKKLMVRIHPDLVVGMGGYVSGAVIYAAGRKHIPAIIHEQNAVLGLANRFSLPFVKSVLMSFPVESKNAKIKFIGHPRKDQMEELFKDHPIHQFSHKKILITSGSGGAQKINDVALELLNDSRSHIYDITLVTGPKYYEGVKEKLKGNHGTHFQMVPFINNLPRAMSEVDLVITRCGSTTIFELLGLKKPGIYIPSPNVVQNHQEKNASFISRFHMGEVILEKNLTKERLFGTIGMMLENPKLESELSKAIDSFTAKKALDQFILEIKKWW